MAEKPKVLLALKTPLKKTLVKRYLSDNYKIVDITPTNLNSLKETPSIIITEEELLNKLQKEYPQLVETIPIVLIGQEKNCNFKPALTINFSKEEISTLAKKLPFLLRKTKKTSTKTEPRKEKKQTQNKKSKLVLIGASTGGPGLIEKIVSSLPKNYPHSICIIQHMPRGFTKRFAERLNSISQLEVLEAEDGMKLKPGRAVIAKAGYHLHLDKQGEDIVCKIVPNTKGLFFVPSVDETFLSALNVENPENIVAVLLTGIGYDGAEGMVALKKAGALTIAESEKTAAVYGMPKVAKEKGGATKVLDFPDILKFLINLKDEH